MMITRLVDNLKPSILQQGDVHGVSQATMPFEVALEALSNAREIIRLKDLAVKSALVKVLSSGYALQGMARTFALEMHLKKSRPYFVTTVVPR